MEVSRSNGPGGAGPPPDGHVPCLTFTTADAPARERPAAWHEAIRPLFALTYGDAPHNGAFAATLRVYHLGALLLCHGYADTGWYTRSVRRLQTDDVDHVAIHLLLRGTLVFPRRSGPGRLAPLDIGVLDLAQTTAIGLRCAESITLVLPRLALTEAPTAPDTLHGSVLTRSSVTGCLLGRHMVSLASAAPRLPWRQARPVAHALQSVVAACLDGPDAATAALAPSGRRGLASRVRLHIERHLQDESLGPATIMADLRLSRSQLYRLFERRGGVQHYIRQRRLRRALVALCDPRQAGRRVTDIAYDAGFSDAAYFSRIFRKTFGMPPRTARAACAGADSPLPDALIPGAGAGPAHTLAAWLHDLAPE